MVKFKEIKKLGKNDIDNKIKELQLDLLKARVAAGKGSKVKLREIKKTLARLIMLSTEKKS